MAEVAGGDVQRDVEAVDGSGGDVDAPVAAGLSYDDVRAAVPAQELGDVAFERLPGHGGDGGPDLVGWGFSEAPVDGLDGVFHRLCARQVLHVEEVDTHLTCYFAVAEQHGDVRQCGSQALRRELRGAMNGKVPAT
jgi:hypothetical protein